MRLFKQIITFGIPILIALFFSSWCDGIFSYLCLFAGLLIAEAFTAVIAVELDIINY